MQFSKHFLTFVIGFMIGGFVFKGNPSDPATQTPSMSICPPCEFNVTAQMQGIPDANPFKKGKVKVSIYFNGLDGIKGILDENNSGHFVGSYKGSSATANCSGSDITTLVCHVDVAGRTHIVDFAKDKK